jgi:transcriptional antiterminator RfaH
MRRNRIDGKARMYWAAAQIRSNEAKRTIWHVQRQGFEIYLPICRPSRRSARIVALFPGYAFIRIIDHWHCLLGTYGVIDIIRSGDSPARVREHEIKRMRDQENRDGVIVLPLTRFQPGEQVRVVRGPMIDRVGIYSEPVSTLSADFGKTRSRAGLPGRVLINRGR